MHIWLRRLALVVALAGATAAPSLHVEPSPLQPNHAIAQATAYDEDADSPDALLGSLLYANGLADYSDAFPLPEGAYEDFRHTMSTCSWTSTPVVAEVLYGEDVEQLFAGSPNYTSWVTPPPVTACEAPDKLRGGTWLAQRVGPFQTWGGYTWHDITVKAWPHLAALFKERDETWVTGASTYSTRADGELLIYPPMHNHHSRIILPNPVLMDDTVILHHQDRVCGSLKGTSEDRSAGYDCMYTRFPDGYGLLMDGRRIPQFTAAFNDVRDAGSTTLSWYVEYAFTIAPLDSVKPRAVYLWEVSHYMPHNEMRFDTFPKKTVHAAITWVHVVPTVSGEVMAIWMHSHENLGHNQTWIFNAAPTELGLNAAPYVLPKCDNFMPDENNMTVDDFKWHVLQSAVSAGAPLRCVTRTRDDISPHLGDEQMTWECAAGAGDRIVAGQNLTSVTFFDAMEGDDDDLTPQHVHWQMYLWDPAGSTTTYNRTWDTPEGDGITLTDATGRFTAEGECPEYWMTTGIDNGGTEPDTEVP